MRNKLNVLVLLIAFSIVVLGCGGGEPRIYNGVELKRVNAEKFLIDVATSNTGDYTDELLLIEVGKVKSIDSNTVILERDMEFYNFGKTTRKLPSPLYITCKTNNNAEKFKSANVEVGDMIDIVGRLSKDFVGVAKINDCEFYNIFHKSQSKEKK